MTTQDEIKSAMATYFAFREPTRSGMATIRLPSRPSAKETTAAAFVLADAYIEEHDDTPISFKEAYAICDTSDRVDIHLERGEVVAYTGWFDGCDYNARPVNISIKSKSQLLALLKGLGE